MSRWRPFRLPRARRAIVDLARDELLARAGLAGDQHGDVGAGDLIDLLEHLDHGRARTDDRAKLHLIQALGEVAQAVHHLAAVVEQHRFLVRVVVEKGTA